MVKCMGTKNNNVSFGISGSRLGFGGTSFGCSRGPNDSYSMDFYNPLRMQGFSISKGINEKRDTDMSFAIALTSEDGIYLAADKRITLDNGLYNDNYQKIAVIPGTNFAVVSTGHHPTKNTTISNIIENIKSKNITEIMEELEKCTGEAMKSRKDWYTSFLVCESLRTDDQVIRNQISQLHLSKNNPPHKSPIFDLESFMMHSLGETWASGIISGFNRYDIPKDNPKMFLNSLFESVIKISQECTNAKSIGGGISILHLTPDGPQWIQK